MAKQLIFIFLFLISLSLTSALTLSMSPPQINFLGVEDTTICQRVILEIEQQSKLIGKDRWAEKGFNERNLLKHNLSNNALNLKVDYPKEINLNKEKEIEVCIEGKEGNYHGVLLYRISEKPVQVGIWMNVTIKEKQNSFLKITGDTTNSPPINLASLTTIILILLFLGVVGLYFRKRKKARQDAIIS